MIRYKGKAKQIYLIFLTGLLLAACRGGKKVDVSGISAEVKIERFDHDFDAMRTQPMRHESLILLNKYRTFYQDYIERIIQVGSVQDTGYFTQLRHVFADSSYRALKHDVDSVFPNLDKQNAELTDAFKHIKYYFPQKQLPKVYAYISGFEIQSVVAEHYVGIGLDMFLGENSRFYPALIEKLPHYMIRRFTPANITPRAVEGMAREDMFPENEKQETMLAKMIYNGKVLYFMDQILPETPDSLKIGYTNAQLKWCTDFKKQIWGFFLEENLLYESDSQKYQKYFGEAPFTPGLGEQNESAPKLGVWTGWQIVRQYMDRHPDVTLAQLMADQDAQKILEESKYRPTDDK